MLANNETGVLQPIEQLAKIAARHGVPLHTDAAQVVGKLPVDFQSLGVAALSLAAHKFHGPPGAGGLVIRHDVTLAPLFHGGFRKKGCAWYGDSCLGSRAPPGTRIVSHRYPIQYSSVGEPRASIRSGLKAMCQ